PAAVELLELAVDVGAGALGNAQDLAAAERIRGLHADQHGELPALDRPPGLRRAVHEAEPTPPRAAALRVDVALERPQPGDLELDGRGLVAGVRPAGLDLAERLVLDRLRHDEPLARLPRPLQPDPVGLLVGVGVVYRPAGECRPAVRVVGARGVAAAEEIARDVEAAVRAVRLVVVPECLGGPEAVEVLAVDHLAAGAQVGGDMEVHVGETEEASAGALASERPAAGVDPRLREAFAVPRAHEREAAGAAGGAGRRERKVALALRDERAAVRGRRDREVPPRDARGSPFRRWPGRPRARDRTRPGDGHQLSAAVPQHVCAEAGRLEVEPAALRLAFPAYAVAVPARRGDEGAARYRAQREAAVGEDRW